MAPDRRQQIEDLFEAVLERPREDRAAFLAAVCVDDAELRAEVEALLAAHERTEGPLERPVAGLAASLLGGRIQDRHIGPYRVLRELGRGGTASATCSPASAIIRKPSSCTARRWRSAWQRPARSTPPTPVS